MRREGKEEEAVEEGEKVGRRVMLLILSSCITF